MKSIIYKSIFIVIFLFVAEKSQGQTLDTISAIDAIKTIREGTLIFVLPSNTYKINEAQNLISKGELTEKSTNRLQKMIAIAEQDQSATIKYYTEVGNEMYEMGKILFILNSDLRAFQKDRDPKYFIGNKLTNMPRINTSSPYIICYPTLSKQQSLEVYAFKGKNNEHIAQPFPIYIRRENGFDNFRHIILGQPIKKIEAERVFKSLNKKLIRII